ncbi:MAG: DUF1957 domain-containing protein, partial [Treponema sp.]|nr:DUF1957 domain-containing protein [Treponema sp.]
YLAHIDRQIAFGKRELERTASEQPELQQLAKMYFDRAVDRRAALTGRYEGNILNAFDYYQRKGKIEILGTAATYAFLPFCCPYPEAVQAQIEVALSFYRQYLGIRPQGFWLPELGWSGEIDAHLKQYNFGFTIVDTHGFVFGRPAPVRGTFFPVKTPSGLFVLGRDFYAGKDFQRMAAEGPYRDNSRDSGYELPPEAIVPCVNPNGTRCCTGFKYWKVSLKRGQSEVYDPAAARAAAEEHARSFLEARIGRLSEAAQHMEEVPLSLCTSGAGNFGRYWYEGPRFLEALFRLAPGYRELQFMTPSEYLCRQHIVSVEESIPEFASGGPNGYAEAWLHASSDWMYRHLVRAVDRMVELAERFPDDTGLKERALNQAAREILLAQASDWPKLLYKQDSTEYARRQIEESLRNFTTIYEALGSNYISTEWLTSLERRHNIFANINYRVFRRKR